MAAAIAAVRPPRRTTYRRGNFRPHTHPQKIRLRLPSRTQKPCRPRHTLAHGKHSPAVVPAHGGQYDHGRLADRPSPKRPNTGRRKALLPERRPDGIGKSAGGWLCTHPLFQNAMCKSHKLHCFSKHLLEKALTARRRRVIVTGTRARPKAFFLPSGFFAPFFSRPFVMQPFVRRPTGRRARFDEGQSAFLRRPPRRRLPRRMGNADAAVSIFSRPSYFPYFLYYPYPYAVLAAARRTNWDTQTGKRRSLPKKRNAVGSSICSRRHRPLTGRLPPICAPDRHTP